MKEKLIGPIAFATAAAAAAAGCGVVGEQDGAPATQESVDAYFEDMDYIDAQVVPGVGSQRVNATLNPAEIPGPNQEVISRAQNAILHIQGSTGESAAMGSGFLYYDESQDRVVGMTAAHVVQGMLPETITITTNQGETLTYESITIVGNFDGENLDIEHTDDLAFIELTNPEAYQERALTARDPADRLKIGEAVHMFNFQSPHGPGYPAAYTELFIGDDDNEHRFGFGLGDVTLNTIEDSTDDGASGGVGLDSAGHVALMSIAMELPQDLPVCGEDVGAGDIEYGNVSVDITLAVPPEANDECDDGLGVAFYRLPNGAEGFIPNESVTPQYIENPNLHQG